MSVFIIHPNTPFDEEMFTLEYFKWADEINLSFLFAFKKASQFTIQRTAHIKFLFNFSETGKLQKRPFCFGNTQEACERASHECTILFVNGCVKLSVFPLSNTLHFLVQVSLSHKNRQQIPVHTIRINNKLPRG